MLLAEVEPKTFTTFESNCYVYPPSTHTFYNADCWKTFEKIPEASVDLVVSDPPYLIDMQSLGDRKTRIGQSIKKSLPNVSSFANGFDIRRLYSALKRLQPKINVYLFCNKSQIPEYIKVFVEEGKCLFDVLVWYKTNAIPAFKHRYLSDKEYLLYFKESGAYCNPTSKINATTVFNAPMTVKEKTLYGHPTVKPLKLIERAIMNSSREGDLILDPFAGTGTTAVAAYNLNRDSINIEINPDYFETMKTRFLDSATTSPIPQN